MGSSRSINLFVSYAKKDQGLADEFFRHLAPLVSQGKFNVLHERIVPIGVPWKEAVQEQIESAEIIILLLSKDYLADSEQWPRLQEFIIKKQKEGTPVVPILIRPTLVSDHFIESLTILRNDRPVAVEKHHDEAWVEVVKSLNRIADEIKHLREGLRDINQGNNSTTVSGKDDRGNGGGGGGGGGGKGSAAVAPMSPSEYAKLALILLVVMTAALFGFIAVAQWISIQGIKDQVYFFILVGLGLVVALITFGTMRSYAHYAGRQLSGSLEVGGPFLAAVIIIVIGLTLVPNDPFSMTVRVQKKGRKVKNATITVDLGSDRREKSLDTSGEANFKEIPKNLWMKKARFEIDSAECQLKPGMDDYEINKVVILICDDAEVGKEPAIIKGGQLQHSKPVINESAERWELSGNILGLPPGVSATLRVRDCPPIVTEGPFKMFIDAQCESKTLVGIPSIDLAVEATGFFNLAETYPKDWIRKNKNQIDIFFKNRPQIDTAVATGNNDYINLIEPGKEGCPEDSLDKAKDKNIIAYTYGDQNMQPTVYGKPDDGTNGGIQITRLNAASSPTAYQVRVAKNCYNKDGFTHGGFYYFIDKTKTPVKKTYEISFCAWSDSPSGLGLTIQHTDGMGEVSNLSRTVELTSRARFYRWKAYLDGTVSGPKGKQQNTPQRYIFGYLYDLEGKRPCDPDPDHQETFAGKQFVISQFRLEMK